MKTKIGLIVVLVVILSLALSATALAGQPNQSCQAQPQTPGNAASAPGSAFNTSGVAGTVYAGTQPQNSNNPNSVSQYDVACFQVSQPHP
ncbi:MAG TPA: adenylate cyclase [Anaerolineae bacterium]